jgi:thiol-disulfide isomerase/thioredoxin
MRFFLLLCFGILLSLSSNAQTHSINGTINGLSNSNVYLLQISGENHKTVDTAFTTQEGSFEFKLQKDFPMGMYAIFDGTNTMIELIYNNENIRFISSGSQSEDNVQIIESIENLIWYDYLYLKGFNQYKLEVIESILLNYPPDDEYYALSKTKYEEIQDLITNRSLELANNNPETFSAKLILVDKPNFAPSELDDNSKQEYLIKHHFDNTDFSDSLLLRSNILTSKIVKYLGLYQRPGLSQEQLENRLLFAVDSILDRAIVNQQVYEAVVSFLIKGFETIGFERGLIHIAEQNQLEELCVNTEKKAELENRMDLIKKLAVGKIAPDFNATDINKKSIQLSKINSDKTILIFWASWCPHCLEVMPVLKEYYNSTSREELEIIAISIDENEKDFLNAVESHSLIWKNIAELKGWNGTIVSQYGINATPSIFILDKDKKILAKPTNKDNLRKEMQK